MSIVTKRCGCDEARWPKCFDHAWYMKHFRGEAPNVTRYAIDVLAIDPWHNTKTEAEDVAEKIRQAIRNKTYQKAKGYAPPAPAEPDKPQGLTVDLLVTLYDELSLTVTPDKTDRSKAEDRYKLGTLRNVTIGKHRFGDRIMAKVTIDDWIAVRAALGDLAHSTWGKYRTLIGQFSRWAKWSGHIPADPIATAPPDLVKRLGRKKFAQRRRRIDEREWSNLLEAATESRERLLPLVLIGLMETAMRIGELLALRWPDVHLVQRQIYVRGEEVGAGKTADTTGGRMIEMFEPMYDLLVGLRRTDPAGKPLPRRAFVFGDPYGDQIKSIDKSFLTAVLRSNNIEPAWTETGDFDARSRAALADIDLNIHDIRHEAACRWLESGQIDLGEISHLLGHSSIAQTATYLHAKAANIRRSRQAYDAWRKAPAAPEPTPDAPAAGAETQQIDHKSITNHQTALALSRMPRLIKGAKRLA